MANLVITVGVAGSGKDTWIQDEILSKYPDVYDVHSSDDIRKELFGEFNQENNGVVFNTMRERTLASLNSGRNTIYNATNLNRRKRVFLYKLAKAAGHNVGIVFFSRSLAYLNQINETREEEKRMSPETIKNMYLSIQTPREGSDCDSFILVGDPFFSDMVLENNYSTLEDFIPDIYDTDIKSEILMNFVPHDTPYHLESINEHIDMTIEAANSKHMKLISLFHDLGKGVSKNGGSYIGHANVGAHYLFNALWHANDGNMELAEVVLYHMQAHVGFSPAFISNYGVSKEVLKLTNYFAKNIDSPSRITAEGAKPRGEK